MLGVNGCGVGEIKLGSDCGICRDEGPAVELATAEGPACCGADRVSFALPVGEGVFRGDGDRDAASLPLSSSR